MSESRAVVLVRPAAEDLLEIVMRCRERAPTLVASIRPVEDWGKPLGDTAAVTALVDRLLHHAHVLTCGPPGWCTRLHGEQGTPLGVDQKKARTPMILDAPVLATSRGSGALRQEPACPA
jgi:hypothetical protein